MRYTKKRYNKKRYAKSKKYNKRTIKGGIKFNMCKTAPKEQLEVFKRDVGHIKIKHFEEVLQNKLENLINLREKCKINCKDKICSTYANDPAFCDQIQSMIKDKPEYDWGNFCSTSGDIIDCKNFLTAFKEIEYYTHYIKSLSDKSQKLFEEYNPKKITPPIPNFPPPIVRTVSNDVFE